MPGERRIASSRRGTATLRVTSSRREEDETKIRMLIGGNGQQEFKHDSPKNQKIAPTTVAHMTQTQKQTHRWNAPADDAWRIQRTENRLLMKNKTTGQNIAIYKIKYTSTRVVYCSYSVRGWWSPCPSKRNLFWSTKPKLQSY